MSKNAILFIATFGEMYSAAQELVQLKNYPIDVILGNTESLPELLPTIHKNNYEIIISRGGTFQKLTTLLTIPIVEVKISAFDILDAYAFVKDKTRPLAFIGFNNTIFGLDSLSSIIGKKTHVISLANNFDEKSIHQQINALQQHGVTEFIGDHIGVKIVQELGFSAHIIKTKLEAIVASIEEALCLLDLTYKERAMAERYKITINAMSNALIALDEFGNIVLFNQEAKRICAESKTEHKDFIRSFINNSSNSKKNTLEIKKITDDCSIALTTSPVMVNLKFCGIVATFQEVKHIQKVEEAIRAKLSEKGLATKHTFTDIIHQSNTMSEVVKKAKKYALSEATVLINAATGCGKELFAHSIHADSLRCKNPFVAINCAALPENLLESELFGYVDGAFTGAKKGGHTGLFELAHKGTLFLDEIGDMPLNLQVKLLRAIQEKEVMRIGSEKITPVDVRIIASTNVKLLEKVRSGTFRDDLYYRLNILPLDIPPLSERAEDISMLAELFLQESSISNHKKLSGFTPEALELLNKQHFPGNVRELRGIIERAVVVAENNLIDAQDLALDTQQQPQLQATTIQETKNLLIRKALEEHNYNFTKTAKTLGINRSTLYRHIENFKRT